MQDEQVEGQAESGEQTADEAPAETEGAAPEAAGTEAAASEGADTEAGVAEGGDEDVAAAVDQQAAESSGTSAESEPEVPDDAGATIQRAQEHVDNLNMDDQHEAAKRTAS